MVSFRGKKILDEVQIGLLKGFNSKFPTNMSTPSYAICNFSQQRVAQVACLYCSGSFEEG